MLFERQNLNTAHVNAAETNMEQSAAQFAEKYASRRDSFVLEWEKASKGQQSTQTASTEESDGDAPYTSAAKDNIPHSLRNVKLNQSFDLPAPTITPIPPNSHTAPALLKNAVRGFFVRREYVFPSIQRGTERNVSRIRKVCKSFCT